MKSVKIEMAGKRFGRLKVLRQGNYTHGRVGWVCRCDCGAVKTISGKSLRGSLTKSCGCLNLDAIRCRATKHGMSRHSAYLTWVAMIRRCYKPNTETECRNYKARGIKVAERWLNPRNFVEDMGERPPRMTIERIDNSGDYEPGNCRWATRREQNQNMRTNKTVYVDGIGMTARQASRLFGFRERRCSDLAKKRCLTHQQIVDGWFKEFES